MAHTTRAPWSVVALGFVLLLLVMPVASGRRLDAGGLDDAGEGQGAAMAMAADWEALLRHAASGRRGGGARARLDAGALDDAREGQGAAMAMAADWEALVARTEGKAALFVGEGAEAEMDERTCEGLRAFVEEQGVDVWSTTLGRLRHKCVQPRFVLATDPADKRLRRQTRLTKDDEALLNNPEPAARFGTDDTVVMAEALDRTAFGGASVFTFRELEYPNHWVGEGRLCGEASMRYLEKGAPRSDRLSTLCSRLEAMAVLNLMVRIPQYRRIGLLGVETRARSSRLEHTAYFMRLMSMYHGVEFVVLRNGDRSPEHAVMSKHLSYANASRVDARGIGDVEPARSSEYARYIAPDDPKRPMTLDESWDRMLQRARDKPGAKCAVLVLSGGSVNNVSDEEVERINQKCHVATINFGLLHQGFRFDYAMLESVRGVKASQPEKNWAGYHVWRHSFLERQNLTRCCSDTYVMMQWTDAYMKFAATFYPRHITEALPHLIGLVPISDLVYIPATLPDHIRCMPPTKKPKPHGPVQQRCNSNASTLVWLLAALGYTDIYLLGNDILKTGNFYNTDRYAELLDLPKEWRASRTEMDTRPGYRGMHSLYQGKYAALLYYFRNFQDVNGVRIRLLNPNADNPAKSIMESASIADL